jgi:hypothetical protein
MKIEQIRIGPELAAQMLENNNNNRPVCAALVDQYAHAMKVGDWKLNGEPIQFDRFGNLLNGQHRLIGVIKSGLTFEFVVIRDLWEVFDTIDCGRKRTGADILGLVGEQSAKDLNCSLGWIWRYENKRLCATQRSIPTTEILHVLERNPNVRESLAFCLSERTKRVSVGMLTLVHYFGAQKNPVLADHYIFGLKHGFSIDDSCFFHVRERLIANYESKAKVRDAFRLDLIIRGWNLRRLGETRKQMKFSTSDYLSNKTFPEIL